MGTTPLVISMGDVCGIGPELIVKFFQQQAAPGAFVVGDVAVFRRTAQALAGVNPPIPILVLDAPDEVGSTPPYSLAVLQATGLAKDLSSLPLGRVDPRAGAAAAACIRQAAQLVQTQQAAALVTAPIHKEALAAAGEAYPGHTELLQDLAGGVPVRMMLANEELKTVLVSIHVSLRQALERITVENILETIQITHASARQWGLQQPRIGVAGLNPHAGENGLFGDEEQLIIRPAVELARQQGIPVEGPFAPDTIFMRARHTPEQQGEFDIVIAMYHDQGLIPIKYLGLQHGVNITLGLPFIRTSPDHGTAFDLAGQGLADTRSFEAAVRWARRLRQGQGA